MNVTHLFKERGEQADPVQNTEHRQKPEKGGGGEDGVSDRGMSALKRLSQAQVEHAKVLKGGCRGKMEKKR